MMLIFLAICIMLLVYVVLKLLFGRMEALAPVADTLALVLGILAAMAVAGVLGGIGVR